MANSTYKAQRIGPASIGYLYAEEPFPEIRVWFKLRLGPVNYSTRLQLRW